MMGRHTSQAYIPLLRCPDQEFNSPPIIYWLWATITLSSFKSTYPQSTKLGRSDAEKYSCQQTINT